MDLADAVSLPKKENAKRGDGELKGGSGFLWDLNLSAGGGYLIVSVVNYTCHS